MSESPVEKIRSGQRNITNTFKKFDQDGNGKIDAGELSQVLESLGFVGDVSALLDSADRNQDELIDIDEFVAWLFADSLCWREDPFLHKLGHLSEKCLLGQTPSGSISESGIVPVVFVPGVLGSHLANLKRGCGGRLKPGHTGFLTAMQGAGLCSSDIMLPLAWEDGRQLYRETPFVATSCISSVGGMVKIYKTLIDWLEKFWGDDFHPFAYDWRRDINEAADLFIMHLKAVVAGSGGRPPIVIAHSTGGLIAMAALNECPELFHSVVFCAAPLGPGPYCLHDQHHGNQFGQDKLLPNILAGGVTSSFPSFHTLMSGDATPWASEVDDDGKHVFWYPSFKNDRGEELDLMDPEVLETYKIGDLWQTAASASDSDLDKLRRHFSHMCAASKRLRERTSPRAGTMYPPMCAVASRSKDTLCQLVMVEGTLQPPASGGFAPGDGRVPWGAARPGGGLPCQMFESACTHQNVPCDLAPVSAAILHAFREREARGHCSLPSSKLPFMEALPEADHHHCSCLIL